MLLQRFTVFPVVVAAVLCTQPAGATDGVIEINQAKALAGGVTDTGGFDSPGYPVTIGEGSYRLTSDLDLRNIIPANTNAIEIIAGDFHSVSIDLNGFAILGSANCTDATPCTNAGTGEGIHSETGNPTVHVRNGKVIGMGSYGIYLNRGVVEVDRVIVASNGGMGIYVAHGLVSQVVAYENGGRGIYVFDGQVRDSYARQNTGYQVQIDNGTIDNCNVEGANTGAAIRIGFGLLQGNFVNAFVGKALECFNSCASTGNKFTNCEGANCFAAGAVPLQVPPASNMCGSVVCPSPP